MRVKGCEPQWTGRVWREEGIGQGNGERAGARQADVREGASQTEGIETGGAFVVQQVLWSLSYR